MNLYFDIGNSGLKWSTDPDPATPPSRLELAVAVEAGEGEDFAARLAAAWEPLARPAAVVACTVAPTRWFEAANALCLRLWGLAATPIVARERGYGVVNRYKEPQRLGADRWAALVAARALGVLPAVVVDCGTAWTVDVLDRDGVFSGGVILASPALAAEALVRRANDIAPAAGYGADEVIPARTTDEAVWGGAVLAAVGGIERALARFAAGAHPYLCGGDAQLLLSRSAHPFVHRPGLVLHGLSVMAAQEAQEVPEAAATSPGVEPAEGFEPPTA